MVRHAPRRDPRASGATGTAPAATMPRPTPRTPAGKFAKPGRQKPPVATMAPPPRAKPPEGSYGVSGGAENMRPAEAVASAEGAQTPEAQAARDRADQVLDQLFDKHEGMAEDSAGFSDRANAPASTNGHPMGEHDRHAAPPRDADDQEADDAGAESDQDFQLALEPVVYPSDDPADAGLPSEGDLPDLEGSLDDLPPNAEALARKALLRSGFLKAEVDAMDPDVLLERGMARHRELAQADDTRRQLAATRKAQVREQPAEPAKAGAPAKGLKERLAPLLEPLGEEGVSTVASVFEEELAPLKAELTALRGVVQKGRESHVRSLVAKSRESLAERFRQLANGRVAGRVEERMGQIMGDRAFKRPGLTDQQRSDQIMLAACLSLGLTDSKKPGRAAASQETRRKQAGTAPTTSRRSDRSAKPLSSEQRMDGVLTRLFDQDLAGARDFGLRTASRF